MTSFYNCCFNYQNALHTICQITSLSIWSIGNQPFTLVAPWSIFKVSNEWCFSNVLVWNANDNILTDIARCILGVVVTGIDRCHQTYGLFQLVHRISMAMDTILMLFEYWYFNKEINWPWNVDGLWLEILIHIQQEYNTI